MNLRPKTPSLTVGLLPRIVFFIFRFFDPIHHQIAVLEDYVTNLPELRRVARCVVSPNVIILFGDVLPFSIAGRNITESAADLLVPTRARVTDQACPAKCASAQLSIPRRRV